MGACTPQCADTIFVRYVRCAGESLLMGEKNRRCRERADSWSNPRAMHVLSHGFTKRSRTVLPSLRVAVASCSSVIGHRQAQLSPLSRARGIATVTGLPQLDTGNEANVDDLLHLKRAGRSADQITPVGIDWQRTAFSRGAMSRLPTLLSSTQEGESDARVKRLRKDQ